MVKRALFEGAKTLACDLFAEDKSWVERKKLLFNKYQQSQNTGLGEQL